WLIGITELQRLVAFYNAGGYRPDASQIDSFAPGLGGAKSLSSQTGFAGMASKSGGEALELSRSITGGAEYPAEGGAIEVVVQWSPLEAASLFSLSLTEVLP